LLAFRARVNSGVKKSAKQATVAQKNAQKFIIINIYIVKPRRVKKIIAVNKNCHATAMPKLPRRISGRVKLHFKYPYYVEKI
jgi:hypothetical protein